VVRRSLQYAKLAIATFCNVFATRTAQLILFSFIVMSGPAGEGKGSGALILLLPVILFSFALAIVARLLGERMAMVGASLVGAGILLWAPWSMIATSANPYMIDIVAGALGALAVLFALSRFALVPAALPSRYIDQGNASIWLGITLATICAAYGSDLLMASSATNAMMNCSAVIFVGGFLSRILSVPNAAPRWWGNLRTKIALPTPATDGAVSEPADKTQPIMLVLNYLKTHRGARDTLRLAVVLSFIFTLWNMLLLCLIMESDEPGGTDLHPLFIFTFVGCALGAFLAPRATRAARPASVLCATVCGMVLSSLICLSATSLTTVKYALGIAGVNSGIALVTIDGLLQRVIPMKMRAPVGAVRDAIVATLVLSALFVALHNFDKVALVNIFRMLALFHITVAFILFVAWPQFARFLYRLVAWPFTARAKKFQCDSPHHLSSTRTSIFALPEQTWSDAAVVCGAFKLPTRFLLITQRLRVLDRFALATIGGNAAVSDADAVEATKRLLRRGYNVILVSDALTDEKSALSKSLYKQFTKQKFQIIPCAVRTNEDKAGINFKCGVPFTKQRVVSPRKLASELNFLSASGQQIETSDSEDKEE